MMGIGGGPQECMAVRQGEQCTRVRIHGKSMGLELCSGDLLRMQMEILMTV